LFKNKKNVVIQAAAVSLEQGAVSIDQSVADFGDSIPYDYLVWLSINGKKKGDEGDHPFICDMNLNTSMYMYANTFIRLGDRHWNKISFTC
jgi:hypothetical protein